MARVGRIRVLKLLVVLLPVLVMLPLVFQTADAGLDHQHFVHDRIAPVPASILALAESHPELYSLPSKSAAESVSAAPALAPSDVGQWTGVYNWPLVAVHTALLPDEKVLMWDAWEFGAAPSARLWDPYTQTFTSVPNTTSGLFCAGQLMLSDGRQLVSGGHNGGSYGINHTNIFNWQNDSWSRVANMNFDRWYPSSILLGDGRAFVLGGQIDPNTYVHIPEVYDPASNTWTRLDSATIPVGNYPNIFLGPDGRIFNISDDLGRSSLLNLSTQSWTTVGTSPLFNVTSVMYRPGKIMMSGGSNDAGSFTSVIDLNQTSPAWRMTSPMAYRRYLHNLVVLPDGNVLTVGGADNLSLVSTTGVLQAEMWNATSETWTQLTPMQNLRMYHSTALLLPDGRVLVAGGGRLPPAVDYPTAEIYSPPYLFNGARPTISSAPASASYGQNMTVQTPDAAGIASVALIRLTSVTHAFNMDQRYIPLAFSAGAGSLTVQAPTSANTAPPGYYMLFILNASGVPSVAKIVQLGGQSQPAPTATATSVVPSSTPQGTPSATPTLTPSATLVVGGGGFPSAPVLDNFTRANGSLGTNWSGATGSYAVASNQLDVLNNGAIFWIPTAFGATQEVFVRLNAIDGGSAEIDLLLKSQRNNTPDGGLIEVWYHPGSRIVQIWTYHPSQGWAQRSGDIPLTLQPGDLFGARARADGFVELYRNSTLIGTVNVRAWPFYAGGGSIGLWVESSGGTFMDDFGGGNTVSGPTPLPTNTPLPSNTPTATRTPSPTATFTASFTPSNTPVLSPTPSNTPVPSNTPTNTAAPSSTPLPSSTPSVSGFPRTVLLDNFNYVNGALGAGWGGATGSYAINNVRLDVIANGAIFWTTPFGANQEVFVNLSVIDLASVEIDLLLKSQRNNSPDGGLIEVWYSPATGSAQIWTYHPSQGWVQRGADIYLGLLPGERFGARARADGFVEVYRGETLMGTRDVRAWPFYASGGYVGLWMENSSSTFMDDFGGGTVP